MQIINLKPLTFVIKKQHNVVINIRFNTQSIVNIAILREKIHIPNNCFLA